MAHYQNLLVSVKPLISSEKATTILLPHNELKQSTYCPADAIYCLYFLTYSVIPDS
jgi:hypothetical protein